MPCREKFPIVHQKALALASAIQEQDPKKPVDIDDAGMRLTLDVVGLVEAACSCTLFDGFQGENIASFQKTLYTIG